MGVNEIRGFVSGYNSNKVGQGAETASAKKNEAAGSGRQAEGAAAGNAQKQDQVVKGSDTGKVTYSRPSTQKMTASQMMALEQQRSDSFTKMLQGMVVRQGQTANLKLLGMDLFVTPADSQKAEEAIAPGGEYSVDAVAGRILDMAKALAGGNDSKISLLREAVEKGFKAAGVDLGGKLPGICEDTREEVMKRFDDWERESSAPKEDETTAAE